MKGPRAVVVLALTMAACQQPNEADQIRGRLHSRDRQQVLAAVYAAKQLRDHQRKDGPWPPTGASAALNRELLAILRTTDDDDLKQEIAGSFMLAPLPGPQPELLDCGRTELREIAVRCLAAIAGAQDHSNLEPLVRMLATTKDVDAGTDRERTAAIANAIRSFGAAAIPYLARLVRSDDPVARKRALYGLNCLESEDAADAALPALLDPDEGIREIAVEVIKLHPQHREALRPLLADPSVLIRRTIQVALGLPVEPGDAAPPPLYDMCPEYASGDSK